LKSTPLSSKPLKRFVKKQVAQGRDLIDRGFDRHVQVAVTGLSGAGKTTFISGLLDQLLLADGQRLPFWQVAQQQRLRGTRLSVQPDQHIPRFQYEAAIERMLGQPPSWPQSTRQLSEIRAIIRAEKSTRWFRHDGDYREVTLDLFDYPGEWLLDLPMLQQSYGQWSAQQQELLSEAPRQALAASWCQQVQAWLATDQALDSGLRELAAGYRDLLHQFSAAGLYLLQPGRMLLPAELEHAPVLDFFPWPPGVEITSSRARALHAELEQRYSDYQQSVIYPFFKKHFKRFNRQVLLLDLLGAMSRGKHAVVDLQRTLKVLLPSFQYGRNSLLQRLFPAWSQSKVERVCIAVTKVDLLAPQQHEQIICLLQDVVQPIVASLRYDGIDVELHAVAGVACTEIGTLDDQTAVVMGWEQAADGQVEQVAVKPPALPARLQGESDWSALQMPKFLPSSGAGEDALRGDALPHLRLDRVLQFLLGDKFS